jgi:hypothetical protein
MNSNIIIAGLAVTVVSLFVIGTIKYIKELESTNHETTHEELD